MLQKSGGGCGLAPGFYDRARRIDSTFSCGKADIAKNVRARASELRACYEAQLRVEPELSGSITVEWTITTDGSVSDAKTVRNSLHNEIVTACVLQTIAKMQFARPRAGVCFLQWPFTFLPD